MQRNNSFRYMIRILAGIYLLYLAWNLMGGLRSGETSGFVFIIGIAVFIVAGVFFILDAVRNILREAQHSQAGPAEDETFSEENGEEIAPGDTQPENGAGNKEKEEP